MVLKKVLPLKSFIRDKARIKPRISSIVTTKNEKNKVLLSVPKNMLSKTKSR